MTEHARIMIAADTTDDAELLTKMLREEYSKISVSVDPDQALADFENSKPQVLLLAFNDFDP